MTNQEKVIFGLDLVYMRTEKVRQYIDDHVSSHGLEAMLSVLRYDILPMMKDERHWNADRGRCLQIDDIIGELQERKRLSATGSVVKDYSKFLQECSRYMTGNKFTGSVKEGAAILERQGAAGNFTTSKKAEINRWFTAEFKPDFSADSIKNHWTLKK